MSCCNPPSLHSIYDYYNPHPQGECIPLRRGPIGPTGPASIDGPTGPTGPASIGGGYPPQFLYADVGAGFPNFVAIPDSPSVYTFTFSSLNTNLITNTANIIINPDNQTLVYPQIDAVYSFNLSVQLAVDNTLPTGSAEVDVVFSYVTGRTILPKISNFQYVVPNNNSPGDQTLIVSGYIVTTASVQLSHVITIKLFGTHPGFGPQVLDAINYFDVTRTQ